MKDLKSFDDN